MASPRASSGSASAFTPANSALASSATTHRDLTAIGTVVNTASRAQSVAEADQILVTQAVFQRTQPDLKDSPSKAFQLKGFDAPIELYAA